MVLTAVSSATMASTCHIQAPWSVVSTILHAQHTVYLHTLAVCDNGDLRVRSTSSLMEGGVEICVNNSYGGICDDFWDVQDARVACVQLGFSNGESVTGKDVHGLSE